MVTDIVMPGMNGVELIKKVKESAPETAIIVLSSFEDFEYVRQTFQYGVADYILKPKLNTKELVETLHKVTSTLSLEASEDDGQPSIEEGLRKLLEGYQSFGEMDALNHHFTYNSFVLIELFWKDQPPALYYHQKLNRSIHQKLNHCLSCPFSLQENHLLLLVNLDLNDIQILYRFIEQTCEENEVMDIKGKVKWIISEPFTALSEIKGIYDLFQRSLHRYHFYLSERNLIKAGDVPLANKQPAAFNLNHMIKLFQHYQFKEAYDYVEEHLYSMALQYDTDVFEFKSWLENIMFNMIVLLGNMDYNVKKMDEEKYVYFMRINEAFHVGEALEIYEEFLSSVKQLTADETMDKTSNIQLMLDYIEEHYNKPLTLQSLADHFHFNPSYLSTYFSKHHHQSFSEYLNHLRIEKAKELLGNTNLSISVISEKVGYSEPSYFTKVFKKALNQSPRNYRIQVKRQK